MSNNPNKVTVIWQGESNISIPYVGLAMNGVAMEMDANKAADFVAQGKASYLSEGEVVDHIDDTESDDTESSIEIDGGDE